jgi:hypothetical protein
MEEMIHEYHEGPKAGENFVKLAQAVFQTPGVLSAAPENRYSHQGLLSEICYRRRISVQGAQFR